MSKSSADALLEELQNWYHTQCDGEWEHEYGIRIDSLDNPGWNVTISLQETELDARPLTPVRLERSVDDWIFYRIEDHRFVGSGGSRNLSEIIKFFLNWATNP